MEKTKTVLLFTSIYPHATGGMEIYNYYLSKNLLSHNSLNIYLYTTNQLIVDNKRVFYVNDKLLLIRRLGLGYLSIFLSCMLSKKIRLKEIKTILIPHTSSFGYNAWPVLLFKRIYKFNYSVHCHGGGLKPWKPFWLQKMFFDQAYNIAGVSHSIVTEFSKRLEYKIQYLPPLVEFQQTHFNKTRLKMKYNLMTFNKIVLYVGSMKPLKSPNTLLSAFNGIDKDYLQAQKTGLVMVGDGILRKELEMQYKNNERIVFLGNIKNEYIHELYTLADIYVIPSWFEGTPISLLEAMFNGMCCVGTNVSGIASVIQNNINGITFEKNDSKTLREILINVLNDVTFANTLGESAKCYFDNHFSYKNHIYNVLKFIGHDRSN